MSDFAFYGDINSKIYENYTPFKFYKKKIEEILNSAGIKINGTAACDIQVSNEKFFKRVIKYGSLGLGESYMEGWWDCEALDEFFYKIFLSGITDKAENYRFTDFFKTFISGCKRYAFHIGEAHYDLGDDFFSLMLDKRMTYSCGYWTGADSLDRAQEAKLDLICRKLDIKEGEKILDIGCGWGSFLNFAAEKYKARPVGVTVSQKQANFCEENFKNIDVRLQDYRDVKGEFDHIISVGMFEHVGYSYYSEFMRMVNRLLKKNGLFLLHTIGSKSSSSPIEPWVDKYIFPGGMLPSLAKIGMAVEGIFVIEDLHNLGADYELTLLAWYKNFTNNLETIKRKYGEKFCRMWEYYLLSYAGAFKSRQTQVWQIVFSKNGVPGGYKSIR